MKISVITVSFNAAATLGDTLVSAANQTYPELEHILIDGGSQDETREVVQLHGKHLAKFISESDDGLYDAMNKGLHQASGDVIGFLHADDLFAHNDVIKKIASAFDDPKVEAIYGDLIYVKQTNTNDVVRYWKSGDFSFNKLSSGWMPPHPTFYVRRSVYEKIGGFDTKYRISADYDSIVRFLFVEKINIKYLPEILVVMRLGGISNRSIKTIIKKSKEDYKIMQLHKLGGVLTLLQKNISKIFQFSKNNFNSHNSHFS
jgi:glycosyltransferase